MTQQRDIFARRTPAVPPADNEAPANHTAPDRDPLHTAFRKAASPTPHRLSIDVDDATYAALLSEKVDRARHGELITIVGIVRAAITEHIASGK